MFLQVRVAETDYQLTFVVTDSTGRFSLANSEFFVDGVNLSPVISVGSSTTIRFDRTGNASPVDSDKIFATDREGEDLTWSLSTNYKPNFGFASVVGRGNQSPIIKYISYSSGVKDLFRIQVSDGTGYEELEITAIIVDSFDTFNVDAPEAGKQIFSGSLYEDYFKVSSSIEGSELRMVLVNGPNWLKVEKVKHGLFRLSGMAPLNVNREYYFKSFFS